MRNPNSPTERRQDVAAVASHDASGAPEVFVGSVTGGIVLPEPLKSELDASQYALALDLIQSAALLFGDGGGGDLGENKEYERGQIELICSLLGLVSSPHDEHLRQAIYSTATRVSADF